MNKRTVLALAMVASCAGGAALADDLKAGRVVDGHALQQKWQTGRYCGVNCLYYMLRLRGMARDYDDIADGTRVAELGSSLEDLRASASRFGMPSEVAEITPETLRKIELPVIAHITNDRDQGHYVILLAFQDQENASLSTVKIIDGTTCRLEQRNLGYFIRMWSGYVLIPKDGLLGQILLRAIYVLMVLLGVACVALLWKNGVRNRSASLDPVADPVR